MFKESLYIVTIHYIGSHAPQRSRDFSRQGFCKHYIWHHLSVIDVGVGCICLGLMGICGSRKAHVRRVCVEKTPSLGSVLKNTIPWDCNNQYCPAGRDVLEITPQLAV